MISIIHHVVGLDVGIENPTFAASTGKVFNSAEKVSSHSPGGHPDELLVEADLLRADLEPNRVVRKWSEPRDARANLRVQVPGGHLATAEGTRLDFQMISSATKLTPTTTLTNLNTAYQSLVEITREPTTLEKEKVLLFSTFQYRLV